MAVGKPLHLRLFLEGVEVPVISAQVTANINGPAAASIQIVPLDEALDFKPRTMVHLFWLDSKARRGSGDLENVGNHAGEYKLLFTGEMIGLAFILTPQSRGIVLQCVDFSSYWDSAHAMALEFGPGGNAFSHFGSIHAGAVGMFDDIVMQQSQRIVDWLRERPKTPGLQTVSGLAGGIIRMMEAIGGVIPHHKGINDFFTVSELRGRMLNQITAEENDNTAARVMAGKVFDQWLRHGLQNAGQQVTFRDMMLMLMKYVYYEFVPNPVAKFDDVSTYKKSVKVPKRFLESSNGLRIKKLLLEAHGIARETADQDIVEAFTIEKRAKSIIRLIESAQRLVNRITSSDLKSVADQVTNHLLKARNSTRTVLQRAGGDFGPDPVSTFQVARGSDLRPAVDSLLAALRLLDEAKQVKTSYVEKRDAQRLRAHIVRPDCWFAPPPACNVIFPEMYSQLSFDRNFLSEVTRLFVATYSTLIGRDALLANDRILAPHDDFTQELAKETGLSGYRVLLDYELHTGIIPRSEWIANTAAIGSRSSDEDAKTAKGKRIEWAHRVALFHFFKYRYAPRQAQVAGRFNPKVVCGFPMLIIRRPFVIPGGLETIREKRQELQGVSSDEADLTTDLKSLQLIHEHADELGAPQQLLGMAAGVTHMVSQEGGNTSVALHSVRQHRGVDDDFLDLFLTKKGKSVSKLLKTSISYSQALADPELMKFLSRLTPQGPASDSAGSVVRKRTSRLSVQAPRKSRDPRKASTASSSVLVTSEEQAQASAPPPFTTRGRIPGTSKEDVLVPSPPGRLSAGDKGRYGGKIVGIEVHEPAVTIEEEGVGRVFSSVTVYEVVDVPVTERVPLERILKPRWFSSAYEPKNIGEKIYQPFFGCDSILDQLRATGVEGFDFPLANEDDSEGLEFSVDQSPGAVLEQLRQSETARVSLSIEKAVNILSYLYGLVRQQGLDVDEFITQYIDRPVATLEDIFGRNLDFDIVGGVATAKPLSVLEGEMRIGFHSTAVHEKLVEAGNLAGLVVDPTLQMNLIGSTGKRTPIPGRYDVRKAKRDKVLAYVSAFKDGTAKGGAFRG